MRPGLLAQAVLLLPRLAEALGPRGALLSNLGSPADLPSVSAPARPILTLHRLWSLMSLPGHHPRRGSSAVQARRTKSQADQDKKD